MKRLLLTTASLLLLSGAAFAQTTSTAKTQSTTGHQTTQSGSTATGNSASTFSNSTTPSATKVSDTQIEQNLEKQGYSNVKVTSREQNRIHVMASKNGQNQNLLVDPSTGQVVP